MALSGNGCSAMHNAVTKPEGTTPYMDRVTEEREKKKPEKEEEEENQNEKKRRNK